MGNFVEAVLKDCCVAVADVLDLDKLEKKKMDFESIEFRLGDLLDSIMTSHKGIADRKRLAFSLEVRVFGVVAVVAVVVLVNLLSVTAFVVVCFCYSAGLWFGCRFA